MSNHLLLILLGIGLLINGFSLLIWDLILFGRIRTFPFPVTKEFFVTGYLFLGIIFLLWGIWIWMKKKNQRPF